MYTQMLVSMLCGACLSSLDWEGQAQMLKEFRLIKSAKTRPGCWLDANSGMTNVIHPLNHDSPLPAD